FTHRNLGCANILSRLNRGYTAHGVFRRTNPCAGAPARPDGVYRHAMSQRDVVAHLIKFCLGQVETRGISAGAVTEMNMSGAFVDREEMRHPVAQARSNVGRIIGEGL